MAQKGWYAWKQNQPTNHDDNHYTSINDKEFVLPKFALLFLFYGCSDLLFVSLQIYLAQSAGAVEYTDCTSAEG